MRVGDLMTTDVLTLNEDDTLDLAHMEMSLARVRHLPVVRGGRLVGLVTHRDILRSMCSVFADLDALEQSDLLKGVTVREIMQANVRTAEPDDDAADAARTLLEGKFGCLPVVEGGDKLVGIITEADFVELAVAYLEESRLEDPETPERGAREGDVEDDERW